jgi:hypothetical protein
LWREQSISGWKKGTPTVFIQSIACANNDCQELTLMVELGSLPYYEEVNEPYSVEKEVIVELART